MVAYDLLNELNNHSGRYEMVADLGKAMQRAAAKSFSSELATSNTLMQVKMSYRHNVVKKTSALVFVQTTCKEVQFPDAVERGESAKELLTDLLRFEECEVHTDLSKHEVVEKISELK